jgi:hypothetical protein
MADWNNTHFEGDDMEADEAPSYRSFAIPADAQNSTSFGDDFFDADGPPVYRSLSFMPQPDAPTMDAGMMGGGAQFDAGSSLSMAMPKLGGNKQGMNSESELFEAQSATFKPTSTNLQAPALSGLYHLERTHFRSGNSASEIVSSLHSSLEQLDAVTLFKEDKLKFKCSVNTSHGAIQFHVRVYQDSGEHIVEIQRRSGCGVGFSMIYRNLNHKLAHLQSGSPTTAPAESMHVEIQLADSNLDTLIEMVKSPYADIQSEGLNTLSRVSETPNNAELMLKCGAMESVCKHLQSENIACQISATRIIANVSKVTERQMMVEKVDEAALAQALTSIIQTLSIVMTTVAVAELQRQSCIALAALSAAFATDIIAQNGREALGQKVECGNPVLAHEARQALASLQ